MGRYLQQQYEERDLAKALAKVHGLIDDDYQELSDRFHDLKLSHNRMENLLKQVVKAIDEIAVYGLLPDFVQDDVSKLYTRVERELNNPLYRCRQKKKGGKRCV